MKKFRRFLALMVLAPVAFLIAPSSAEAAFPNDCSQVSFFSKRVCLDPNAGGYGPILSVWNNNVLTHAFIPTFQCNENAALPVYQYPGYVSPGSFAGAVIHGGQGAYTGVTKTSPDFPVKCNPGSFFMRMPSSNSWHFIAELLQTGGYTWVTVNYI